MFSQQERKVPETNLLLWSCHYRSCTAGAAVKMQGVVVPTRNSLIGLRKTSLPNATRCRRVSVPLAPLPRKHATAGIIHVAQYRPVPSILGPSILGPSMLGPRLIFARHLCHHAQHTLPQGGKLYSDTIVGPLLCPHLHTPIPYRAMLGAHGLTSVVPCAKNQRNCGDCRITHSCVLRHG